MSIHLQRAALLLQQSRFALAEEQLRLALAEDPDLPAAHALLAECLRGQNRGEEALTEARIAVQLAPDDSLSHYYHALTLQDLERFAEAEAAIAEAIRLSPQDADYYGVLATVRYSQGQWGAALQAADEGLANDPEHVLCVNLRGMALTKLGRTAEAHATVDGALARDPENALSHAVQGWNCLERSRPQEALEHFRIALRINPELDYAREGMVEALKARHFVYRVMLRWFLWMSRLSGRAQWAVIIGLYLAFRALGAVAKNAPEWSPLLMPLIGLYAVFCVLTWVADPMFNLLLRLHPFGRYALSSHERTGANWFGGFLATAILLALAGWATGVGALCVLAVWFLLMLAPVSMSLRFRAAKKRWIAVSCAAALGVVGLLAIGCGLAGAPQTNTLVLLFMLGWIAFPWLSNTVASV